MDCTELIFTGHAMQRMFERRITTADARHVVEHGKVIAAYPEDRPYPSYLLLGFSNTGPIHVVVAIDASSQKCFVVTVYVPDKAAWTEDYELRR
jgi:hypothetical protein